MKTFLLRHQLMVSFAIPTVIHRLNECSKRKVWNLNITENNESTRFETSWLHNDKIRLCWIELFTNDNQKASKLFSRVSLLTSTISGRQLVMRSPIVPSFDVEQPKAFTIDRPSRLKTFLLFIYFESFCWVHHVTNADRMQLNEPYSIDVKIFCRCLLRTCKCKFSNKFCSNRLFSSRRPFILFAPWRST